MKNQSFFSITRFYTLLRNDLLLNAKQYLVSVTAGFILMAIIIYMVMSTMTPITSFSAQGYMYAFSICLLALGAFIGSAFPAVSNKRSLSVYLLTPASVFEKFLVQFTIRILLGALVFLVIFYIDAYFIRSIVLEGNIRKGINTDISYFSLNELFLLTHRVLDRISFVFMIVSFASYLFSVRLFFQKIGLIKTVATIPIPILFIVAFLVVLSHIFTPTTIGIDINVYDYYIDKNIQNTQLWIYTLISIPWLFLLPMGFFKLKEKQL